MDLRAAQAPARECPYPSFPQESWPRLSNSLVFLHCRHRDSEEKHEPVSDIDTVVVDSLKALDPNRPIREATELLRRGK
jgi:hypothetical protein